MTIVELQRQRGHLYRLVLEDGQELLLDRDTVDQSSFGVNGDISEEQLEALREDSALRRAKSYALYLIGIKDYTELQLRRKLREKGHSEKAAQIAARMVELGLVNDEIYARRMARECRLHKLYGRRRVVQELCAKGVDREIAARAADEVDESEKINDLQQAIALLEKKRYNISNSEQERRRAGDLLLRYGYGWDVIRQALRAASEDNHGDMGE